MSIFNQKPNPIPFTKQAYEKMQADFDRLTAERVEVVKRLQTAREMGDLSENGAYKYAKFELGSIGRQLRDLNYKLRYGVVTETKKSEEIVFGSRVVLDDGKRQLKFMLVSEHESDPMKQKLSMNSPLGRAVMGKKVGDKVIVAAPAGQIIYTIVEVE